MVSSGGGDSGGCGSVDGGKRSQWGRESRDGAGDGGVNRWQESIQAVGESTGNKKRQSGQRRMGKPAGTVETVEQGASRADKAIEAET